MLETFSVHFDLISLSLTLLALVAFAGCYHHMQHYLIRSLLLVFMVLSSFLLLGKPLPYCPPGVVQASYSIYGQGIYMVVDERYCALPWDEDIAEEQQTRAGLGVPFYFDPSFGDDDMFHDMPQPGTPPKEDDEPQPREYGV